MSSLDTQDVPVVVALCTSRADAYQLASEQPGRKVVAMSGYWLVTEGGGDE